MEEELRRPYGSGVERVTISLAPGQLDQLDELGRDWGLNRSEMARLAIIKLLRDPVLFLPSVLSVGKRIAAQQQADESPRPDGEAA